LKSEQLSQIIKTLGIEVDEQLLLTALTHRSFANELKVANPKAQEIENYERLEFLGDSVLGLIVTEELFKRFPNEAEGQLSPLRSGIVNTKALAQIARNLGLGKFLQIGKGEETTGGREKTSILADACEAVFGAIYLSNGYEKTNKIILKLLTPIIEEAITLGSGLDGKTALQDLSAASGWLPPEYQTTDEGPDHDKKFTSTVLVNGEVAAVGIGKSKREAEQAAARTAYSNLKNN
jgi:ribonuclease-3